MRIKLNEQLWNDLNALDNKCIEIKCKHTYSIYAKHTAELGIQDIVKDNKCFKIKYHDTGICTPYVVLLDTKEIELETGNVYDIEEKDPTNYYIEYLEDRGCKVSIPTSNKCS